MTRLNRRSIFAAAAVIAVLSAGSSFSRAADPIEAKSTIDAVTVYRGQALVTRVVEIPGPAGLKDVLVKNLPDQIEPASLYAEGGDGVEGVRSVSYSMRPIETDVRKEVQDLDDQMRKVQDNINANQKHRQALDAQRDYLVKLETFTASTSTTELSKGVLNADTLTKVTEYQFKERNRIVDDGLKFEIEARSLGEQLQTLQRQRSQIATNSSKVAREARLVVNTTAANGKVRLRYIVNNATWLPSYNVKVMPERDKVTVEYLASIQQMSGEDWNGVLMTLSTATPSLVAKAPVLNELAITLAKPGQPGQTAAAAADQADQTRFDLRQQQQALEAFRGTIGSNSGNGLSQLSNNGGYISVTPQQGNPSNIAIAGTVVNIDYIGDNNDIDLVLNKTAADLQMVDLLAREKVARTKDGKPVVRAVEEGLAITYELAGKNANRTSLQSRSDRQLIQIATVSLPAQFYKVASPVLSSYIYDEADVTNDSQIVFLYGDVATYVNNQFVGRGVMPSVAAGQTFSVGLGIDSSLRAHRDLVEKTETPQGGNRVVDFTYRLSLENFANKPAKVRLLDRMPTAKETEIKVTLEPQGKDGKPLSTDPDYLQTDFKKKILRWDLEVPAQAVDTKALMLEYQFKLEYAQAATISTPAPASNPGGGFGGGGGAGGRGGAGRGR